MSHAIRINLDDAERAHALVRSVNNDSSQSGLHAQAHGAEVTIAVANPLLGDLIAGIGGAIAWVRRRFPDGDAPVGNDELPEAR